MATSTLPSPSVYDFGMSFRPTDSSCSIPIQTTTSTLPSMAERQRPKLSLNTTSGVGAKRSFGRGNTGLRLDTLGDASPTTRNTTHNTLGMPQDAAADRFRTKPRKPLFPRLDTSNLSPSSPQTSSPQKFRTVAKPQDSTTNSPTTTPGASRPSSRSSSPKTLPEAPYILDAATRSILRNAPLQKRSRPPPTPSSPAPANPPQPVPSEAQPQDHGSPSLRSPSIKKLRFRDPLEEEVQTNTYLMRHSDLRSRSVSPATPEAGGLGGSLSMTPLSSSRSNTLTASHAIAGGLIATGSRAGQPIPRAKEVAPTPAVKGAQEDAPTAQSHSILKTPVAGRDAKDRDWRWTLGPLPGLAVEGSALPGHGSQASSDDEDLEASLGETVAASKGYHVSTPQTEEEDAGF